MRSFRFDPIFHTDFRGRPSLLVSIRLSLLLRFQWYQNFTSIASTARTIIKIRTRLHQTPQLTFLPDRHGKPSAIIFFLSQSCKHTSVFAGPEKNVFLYSVSPVHRRSNSNTSFDRAPNFLSSDTLFMPQSSTLKLTISCLGHTDSLTQSSSVF